MYFLLGLFATCLVALAVLLIVWVRRQRRFDLALAAEREAQLAQARMVETVRQLTHAGYAMKRTRENEQRMRDRG